MSRMIQLRNVPDDVHARLKAKAALAGKSLSDYLIEQARIVAERPMPDEMKKRLAQRSRVAPRISPTAAVRRERDAR